MAPQAFWSSAALAVILMAVGCWADQATPAPTPWLSVAVNPKKMSALVGDRFLSLTMDPMELSEHRKLGPGSVRSLAMARGLSPAYLRVAGPSSDKLRFERGDGVSRNGTVTEADLSAVARWTRDAGWHLIVGLNALLRSENGDWDGRTAMEMLALADKKGYPIDWQLGYETTAMDKSEVSGVQVGADLSRLRSLLAEFPRYKHALLLGPDLVAAPGGPRLSARDAAHFLQDEARLAAPSPDAVVWQPWSTLASSPRCSDTVGQQSEGKDPVNNVNNPDLLREDVNRLLGRAAARRPLWISESDDAPSRAFGGALQWAQRVQMATRVGADVIFRRWLTPGEDHQPTPDFWVSLLHKRLCGRAVLDSRLAGNRSAASVTAQCTSAPPPNRRLAGSFSKLSYERGDVTLFAVNSGPADVKMAAKFSPAAPVPQQGLVHEYILTAPGHDMGSRSTLLNGKLLAIDSGGGLPVLTPRLRHSGGDRETTLTLPPHSVAFFVFPGVHARVCESAPISAFEAVRAEALLQLSPSAGSDMQVQFHVEGLPSKSKTKEKLAATLIADNKDSPKNFLYETLPLSHSPKSSLEQFADLGDAKHREKRATTPPLHPVRPGPMSPEDLFDRLTKSQAAHNHAHGLSNSRNHLQASKRKPPAVPSPAATTEEESDEALSTIPAGHFYRPDNSGMDGRDQDSHPPRKLGRPALPKLSLKFKLPKRPPLKPAPPRHQPGPAPRLKPIPKGVAVASLVDPEHGVSAEEESEEVETPDVDNFPTGVVLAELGTSDEQVDSDDSSATKSEEGGFDFDYLSEEEDGEGDDKKEAVGPKADKDSEKGELFYTPGGFMATKNAPDSATSERLPPRSTGGELDELNTIMEPVNVAAPSTPSPYEPHFEDFFMAQAPLAPQGPVEPTQDLENFYQGAVSTQEVDKDPEQELNTDLLIELGKKYLRENKMALKSAMDPEVAADEAQHVRKRRQVLTRLKLPTGASGKPIPRLPPWSDSGERAPSPMKPPREIRKELDQLMTERRERLDKVVEKAKEREQPDSRITRTREQLEQQRQQREQAEKERLAKVREQLEQQPRLPTNRQQDDRRLAKTREQLDQQRQLREQQREQQQRQLREQRLQAERQLRSGAGEFPRLRDRVKRSTSDVASRYMDSFGDALPRRLPAHLRRVVPAPAPAQHHHHHAEFGASLGTPSTRYRYGYTPQNVHKNVRHQVVKKTNVVRYLPVDDDGARQALVASTEDLDQGARAEGVYGGRGRQQVYRPHDNVATLWADSPLSPLRQRYDQDDAPRSAYDVPVVSGAALLSVEAEDGQLPAELVQAPEAAPTEVKTTNIVKTERTYETPESVAVWKPSEDSGYDSEMADAEETRGSRYPSPSPIQQTGCPHRQHLHLDRGQDGRDCASQRLGGEVRAAPRRTAVVKEETTSTEYGWQSSEDDAVPEFPFRTPDGHKSQVVGYKADDSSPGGWYTFSTGQQARVDEPKQVIFSIPSESRYPPRVETQPAETGSSSSSGSWSAPQTSSATGNSINVRTGSDGSWSVPLSHASRTDTSTTPTRYETLPNFSPAIDTKPPVSNYPAASNSWGPSRPQTVQPSSSISRNWQESPPRVAAKPALEVRQPVSSYQAGSWASSQPRVKVTPAVSSYQPYNGGAARAEAPVVEATYAASANGWSAPQPQAPPAETARPVFMASTSAHNAPQHRAPAVKASQPASRYQFTSAEAEPPSVWTGQSTAIPVPEVRRPPVNNWSFSSGHQAVPATIQSDSYATQPQSSPRQAAARRAQPKPPVQFSPALSYMSKFFQPVEGAVTTTGVARQRPAYSQQTSNARNAWNQPPPADDLWKQPAPAPADDLWKQPTQADNLWKQPTQADNLWKQPTQTDNLWKQPTQTDNLWKQPTQADNLWREPSSVDDLWKQQAAPVNDIWGQPAIQRATQPVVQHAKNTKQASLAVASGEQLLDYNTDILRRTSGAGAASAPSLQFASLAPAGGGPVQRPRAQWPLRKRRSLSEPASAASARSKRGLLLDSFGGINKGSELPDEVTDEEWSAETERMRKKKQERQNRKREQERYAAEQDKQHNIQVLGENGYLSGVVSSFFGKVAGVLGYLGRLTTPHHS